MFEEFLPKNMIGELSPLAAIDNVATPGIWQVATVILTDYRGLILLPCRLVRQQRTIKGCGLTAVCSGRQRIGCRVAREQEGEPPHRHSRRQILMSINRLLPDLHNECSCVITSMTAGWPVRTISMGRSSVGPNWSDSVIGPKPPALRARAMAARSGAWSLRATGHVL